MRNKISNSILGLVFIAFGVIYLGKAMDWWDYSIFFDGWWTLFIIVPAILSIVKHGVSVGNLLVLGIGCILLIDQREILGIDNVWKLCVPVGLILIGGGIIFGGSFRLKNKPAVSTDGSLPNETAILGGREPNYSNLEFKGTSCTAIMGGVDLNLKAAIIRQDCEIVCYCVMGGIDILLPPNLRVVTNVTPILGGVENRYVSSPDTNQPTVTIVGTVIMGGIDIK
ncbi:MAG: LiaF domain-containing protein [Oscillospiraceae bacterium]|jgi:predicted membrane protein